MRFFSKGRPLTIKEKKLIWLMVKNTPYKSKILSKISAYKVIDMDDGDMGSITVVARSKNNREKFSRIIAQKEFKDSDGVMISVAVIVDNYGDFYELDIWKVNFQPILNYPSAKSEI